jgi:hypothetical protein
VQGGQGSFPPQEFNSGGGLGMPHGVAGREMVTSASPRATISGVVDRITGLEETLIREVLDLMQRTRLALLA